MSDVTPEALAGALARIEALEAERDAERALADQLANGWWENSDKSLATFNLPAFAAWRAARSEVEQ